MCGDGDEVVVAEQAGFCEDEFPVVEAVGGGMAEIAAEEGQLAGPGIIDVGGDVEKVLSQPPEADSGSERIPGFEQQDEEADQRDQQLAEGAAEGGEKITERAEEDVSGFVKGEVDQVQQ